MYDAYGNFSINTSHTSCARVYLCMMEIKLKSLECLSIASHNQTDLKIQTVGNSKA